MLAVALVVEWSASRWRSCSVDSRIAFDMDFQESVTYQATQRSLMLTDNQLDQIRNVIIVTMENRSFDHALGYLSLPESGYANWQKIEGIRQASAAGYTNLNPAGAPIPPHLIDTFWNAAQD